MGMLDSHWGDRIFCFKLMKGIAFYYSVSRSYWWSEWCADCFQGSPEAFQKKKQPNWTILSQKGQVNVNWTELYMGGQSATKGPHVNLKFPLSSVILNRLSNCAAKAH